MKRAFGDELEIMASSRKSRVKASGRLFEIDGAGAKDAKDISIDDLDDLSIMQLVTVNAKVLFVGEPQTIRQKNKWKTLRKQECIIGDTSGTTRIVVWENDVGRLTIDKSYKITDVTVCIYKCINYLSASKKCNLDEIDDISDVVQIGEMAAEDLKAANMVTGCIKAVVSREDYACRV